MPEILLQSVEELTLHVEALPPWPAVDVWWVCPKCGTKNYGMLLGRPARCPECREYEHPPAGTPEKAPIEVQIERVEDEIAELREKMAPLEDKLGELEDEYAEKRRQLMELLRLRDAEKRVRVDAE